MRSQSQVSGVTIHDRRIERCVSMNQCVNATAYPNLVSSYNNCAVLTFFNCANLADFSNKNCTVNARLNQGILNCSININVRLFTANDAKTTSIIVVWVEVLVVFDIDAFVKAVEFVKIFHRLLYG